jgi:hypothetical protein
MIFSRSVMPTQICSLLSKSVDFRFQRSQFRSGFVRSGQIMSWQRKSLVVPGTGGVMAKRV